MLVITAVTTWVWQLVLCGRRVVDEEPIGNPDLILRLYEHALVHLFCEPSLEVCACTLMKVISRAICDITFIKAQAHTSVIGWQYRWKAKGRPAG
jgi:hypothetical protein